METNDDDTAAVASAARDVADGWEELVERIGGARYVLIGTASHGTREFYQMRADLTRRLIAEKGFRVVALEADWPDTMRVHRYVSGQGADNDGEGALFDFRRFPHWLWRNEVMPGFVEWLREWNAGQVQRAGIFGMDLYSLHASLESVLRYLKKVDPAAAKRAKARYACFDHMAENPHEYGIAAATDRDESCEEEAVAQLMEIRRSEFETPGRPEDSEDERFFAEQNAKVVADAERYYRAMFRGHGESWNMRDRHMAERVLDLAEHFGPGDKAAKTVVWAHNLHLGDSRATEMAKRGQSNVGRLLREKAPGQVVSIGFTTYAGRLTAAGDWDGPPETMAVRPALTESYEALFHRTGRRAFWLDLREMGAARDVLARPRLQRSIGVIYRPETERWSHYMSADLTKQFDFIIHVDTTTALPPLHDSPKPARDRPCDPPAEI